VKWNSPCTGAELAVASLKEHSLLPGFTGDARGPAVIEVDGGFLKAPPEGVEKE
jgi:hypothetical protein